MKTYCNW